MLFLRRGNAKFGKMHEKGGEKGRGEGCLGLAAAAVPVSCLVFLSMWPGWGPGGWLHLPSPPHPPNPGFPHALTELGTNFCVLHYKKAPRPAPRTESCGLGGGPFCNGVHRNSYLARSEPAACGGGGGAPLQFARGATNASTALTWILGGHGAARKGPMGAWESSETPVFECAT